MQWPFSAVSLSIPAVTGGMCRSCQTFHKICIVAFTIRPVADWLIQKSKARCLYEKSFVINITKSMYFLENKICWHLVYEENGGSFS
jgi:hypothetical protein